MSISLPILLPSDLFAKMTTERSDLRARTLPQILLGDGSPRSLTAPPPSLSQIPAASRAQERFRVTGNAIVTGGAGDLGFAASRALLEHGVEGLMIFDMNPTEAQAKVDLLSSEFPGAKIQFLKVDVTDEDGVDAAVGETIKLFGSISTLVSFAGMVACGHALDWSAKDWNRVINVNTIGGFLVARAVARTMIEREIGGSMTFIASMSAHRVNFPQPVCNIMFHAPSKPYFITRTDSYYYSKYLITSQKLEL